MRLIAALLLSGSLFAHSRPPSTWTLASSTHFEIYSQSGEASARSALLWFEQLLAFFERQTGLNLDNRPPVRVIAFRSYKDYQPYRLRLSSDAYYVGAEARDYIVLPAADPTAFHLAAHEYAHVVLHARGQQLPRWLSEGLAEFFSTVRISEHGCTLGGDLPARSQTLQRYAWMPLSQLLTLRNDPDDMGLFYAQSWALTEMLAVSPDYASRFQTLLSSIASGTPSAQALSTIYARPLDAIARDLRAWADSRHKLPVLTLPGLSAPAISVKTSTLSPIASDSLIAGLLLAIGDFDRANVAYRHLAQESPHDPNVSAALGAIALHNGETNIALKQWQRAIDNGIEDAALCYRYAMLAEDAGIPANEVRPAFEEAIRLRPDFDDARYSLALLESNAGHYDSAITQLRAMRTVSPGRAYAYWTAMSYALNEAGKRDEAIDAAHHAMQHAATATERANASQLAYVAQTDLAVRFTRDANGREHLETTRVPRNTLDWNPFIEPSDNIRRVEAKLREFTCTSGRATGIAIETSQGPLTLTIPDPSRVLMRNAPSEFTCGPQPANAVLVEYAASQKRDGTADGVLRGMAFR